MTIARIYLAAMFVLGLMTLAYCAGLATGVAMVVHALNGMFR